MRQLRTADLCPILIDKDFIVATTITHTVIERANTFEWTMLIQPSATLLGVAVAIYILRRTQKELDRRQRIDHSHDQQIKSAENFI